MIKYYKISFADGRKIFIQFNEETKMGVEVTPKSLVISKGEYVVAEPSSAEDFFAVLDCFQKKLRNNLEI